MANKTPMKDMIIILPGILGSVLKKDGKDLWAPSGKAIWNVLTNTEKTIQNLTLGQDSPDASDLGDGVVATAMIPDVHLIPGLWKIDGYTQTAKIITDNFDVKIGNIYNDPDDKAANLYAFPYDWRRDNRAIAKNLKRLIDKRLKCWREQSGAADAKVILLAHSMGGLVSRYYLEVLEGWRDCRALFTFGTPYRGSLNAVGFLANGYKQLFLDLTSALRSFTSVYQLLPIYPVVKIGDTYHRVAEADGLPNIDKARAASALAFHREIEAAVEQHLKLEQYRQDYTTVPFSGIQQPTLQSATLMNGRLTVTGDLPAILQNRLEFADGDGTVPQISSIPIERSQSFDNFFIAEQHGSLQNQEQILENLQKCLEVSQFDLSVARAPQAAISLSLEDLYLPNEPILFGAKLISAANFGKLQAEVKLVGAGDLSRKFNFCETDAGWELVVDDLPAGLYRVTVQTEVVNAQAPAPVHGLFTVVSDLP
jgi:pimeloyl-ACP methyl ester carboxylesterase